MGLTKSSVGKRAVDKGLVLKKQSIDDKVIAIGGNPNVGKSTLFNSLTGLSQHTGNWPGKTVSNASGFCKTKEHSYIVVDIPGTYSLMAHSTEEEVARNFICFGEVDAVVIVCDATCLERNLNLVLQTIEITNQVLVCVNLLDEAKRKKIHIDLEALSKRLGVPVVGTVARKKRSLQKFLKELDHLVEYPVEETITVNYPLAIEEAIDGLERVVQEKFIGELQPRWISLKLLEGDESLIKELGTYYQKDLNQDEELQCAIKETKEELEVQGIDKDTFVDQVVSALLKESEMIAKEVVAYEKSDYDEKDRKIDRIITNKWTGYPLMIALLGVIFWITITGANYPSQLLADGLFFVETKLYQGLAYLGVATWLNELLIFGIYRVLAWVVSVMLPPMAIFFPLFTLLEDAGYLPRVAYNLDKHFKRCCACGKQALTMCMGFGCNAAGIIGCRIIDSDRERLMAMITNNFVPCNGRFPTLIAIITMFFVGTSGGLTSSALSAVLLTGVIVLGIVMTFVISKVLSKTILKGIPSSFTLELPPYRRPQVGKVIVRSIFDRTLFVLGRAVVIAAPAGLVIWILANVTVGDASLLAQCAEFLDPFAKLIGLDGVILMAFILGLPANEIVFPIIIMAYLSKGSLIELDNLVSLKTLLVENGWTWVTAICTMLFSLMHWPCSTTLLTIKKESGSLKWMFLSFLIPTVTGIIVCGSFAAVARIFF